MRVIIVDEVVEIDDVPNIVRALWLAVPVSLTRAVQFWTLSQALLIGATEASTGGKLDCGF